MAIPKDVSTGTVHQSKVCGSFTVIEYRSAREILIRFNDTGFEKTTRAYEVRTGNIKDPLMPVICGIGFYGDGEYRSKAKGKHTPEYLAWRHMIRRCYDKKDKRYNLYGGAGVKVCQEWHNFQNYAKWYNLNHPNDGKKYQVDKDIKIDGNKLYSPDTCIFATPQENSEKACAKIWSLISPSGNEVQVYNLAKFCRENNLHMQTMWCVMDGRRKHHKGWTKAD